MDFWDYLDFLDFLGIFDFLVKLNNFLRSKCLYNDPIRIDPRYPEAPRAIFKFCFFLLRKNDTKTTIFKKVQQFGQHLKNDGG